MSKIPPTIEHLPTTELRPHDRNARTHSTKQISQIAASIRAFGFNNPVLVDKDGIMIAGHGRVAAAKKLGHETVPVIRLEHMSDAEKRAYILADNKLAEKAGWDREILAIELQHLTILDVDFDVTITGFEMGEIDVLLGEVETKPNVADVPALPPGPAVTRHFLSANSVVSCASSSACGPGQEMSCLTASAAWNRLVLVCDLDDAVAVMR